MSLFEHAVQKLYRSMNDATVAFDLYRVGDSHNEQTRRVVWIPLGGVTGPVLAHEPDTHINGFSYSALYTDQLRVAARCRDRTYAEAEALRHQVLLASFAALANRSRPAEFEWDTQVDDVAGHVRGEIEIVTQIFTWQLPVLRERVPIATIATISHQCTIDVNL